MNFLLGTSVCENVYVNVLLLHGKMYTSIINHIIVKSSESDFKYTKLYIHFLCKIFF